MTRETQGSWGKLGLGRELGFVLICPETVWPWGSHLTLMNLTAFIFKQGHWEWRSTNSQPTNFHIPFRASAIMALSPCKARYRLRIILNTSSKKPLSIFRAAKGDEIYLPSCRYNFNLQWCDEIVVIWKRRSRDYLEGSRGWQTHHSKAWMMLEYQPHKGKILVCLVHWCISRSVPGHKVKIQ